MWHKLNKGQCSTRCPFSEMTGQRASDGDLLHSCFMTHQKALSFWEKTHIYIYVHVLFMSNNSDSLATPQSLTYSCNNHSNPVQNGRKQSKRCTKKGHSKNHEEIVWSYTLLTYLVILFPAFFKDPTTSFLYLCYCYFSDLRSDEGFITTTPWSCYMSYSNTAAHLVRFTIQTSAGSWIF